MAMTGKKVKISTDETLAAPKEGLTARFSGATASAIWLNVFDKLDLQDKLTFSSADSEWHEMVDSKRTLFFYPEVAPILMRIFSLKNSEILQFPFWEVASVDPELLPRRQSLKCRELCKLWNLEWDRQTVTHPSNLTLEFEMEAAEFWSIPDYTTRFHSAVQIQQFLKDIENHPGNPFPGRYIRLCWFDVGTNEDKARLQHEYGNAVVLLLEKFGKHVHYSTIVLTRIYGDGLDNKALLRNALLHLPNLRKLEIYDTDFAGNYNGSQVDEFYRQTPLPLMENLETLLFHLVAPSMINSLLSSCCFAPAVKRLQLDISCSYHLGQFDAVYTFRNLEVLRAPLFIQDFERLNSQREVPPLRELDVKWRDALNFHRLLRALEPFGNSLVSLMTDRTYVWSKPKRQVKINLPNLRQLHFLSYEGSMDPLLQLTSLTHIGIYFPHNPRRFKQKIKFYGLEQQMEKSNIWGLMPNLKTFEVGSKMFYRGDAENQVEDQGEGSN